LENTFYLATQDGPVITNFPVCAGDGGAA